MKYYLILVACFLAACNANNREEKTEEGNVVKDVRVIDSTSAISGCYTAVLQRDTADMVIQHEPGAWSVSGDLVFNNFEKDDSKGTFNGKLEGDQIVAYYDFFSEGLKSVRQIVFKVTGDTLFEAYGNIIQSGDTTLFKNLDNLELLTEKPYIKRDCK